MSKSVRADKITPAPPVWIWRERIPRSMLTFLAGKRDQGKSLMAATISADVSRTNYGGRRGRVIYSGMEDSWEVMTRPRLEAAGADLSRISLCEFRLPLEFEELEYRLTHNDEGVREYADLLVLDPFAAHLSGGVSRFSDSIREVTTPLYALAKRTKVAMLIVEHALKRIPPSGDPLDAIGGGSSGLVAATRMGFMFGANPEDEDQRLLCTVKHNICEPLKALQFEMDTILVDNLYAPALVYQGETVYDPMNFLTKKTGQGPGRPANKRAGASEWLAQYLHAAGQAIPAGKVLEDAKHYGMTNKVLRAAATDLGVIRDPPGGGRNCTWSLPDEVSKRMGNVNDPLLSDEDIKRLLGNE